MKYPTSKNIEPQIKGLRLARDRARKVKGQLDELSNYRADKWKGSEMPLAEKVNDAREELLNALQSLARAEGRLEEIKDVCAKREAKR